MTARKRTGDDDPEANQDLPEDQPVPDQELPEPIDESPADAEGNRGKSDEAHANAPGQQKKPQPREDPNTYPDPDNPPHTP